MTNPTVSDAEVEAVANAYYEIRRYRMDWPALRAALLAAARVRAIPETEAVAWCCDDGEGGDLLLDTEPHTGWRPLYTHPDLPDTREGFKLVPIEPTKAMLAAAKAVRDNAKPSSGGRASSAVIYRAMIAASPATGEREP